MPDKTKKQEKTSPLRVPQSKKKLGLKIVPILKDPHEELIKSPIDLYPKESNSALLPSPDQAQTPPRPNPDHIRHHPDQTQTRTRPTHALRPAKRNIAPMSDFNKRDNSIERDALPAGLLPGACKAIYDALYFRTFGAIVSTNQIQATRKQIMEWSGVKNIKTVNSNLTKLKISGLITIIPMVGEQSGSIYELRLPKEVGLTPNPAQTQPSPDPAQTDTNPNPTQKMDRDQSQKTVWAGLGQTIENNENKFDAQTLIKTREEKEFDDEPQAAGKKMIEKINQVFREVTGREINERDETKLTQIGELIAAEFAEAAARTKVVSDPAAFLLAHLRRRLGVRTIKVETATDKQTEQGSNVSSSAKPTRKEIPLTDDEIQECPDCQGRLIIYPAGPGKGAVMCKHHSLIKAKQEEGKVETNKNKSD